MSLNISSCYASDGTIREIDIPCDPNAEVSACCGTGGSFCVDNLHCISPQNARVPGTCTNQAWGSYGGAAPGCPCPPRNIENQGLTYLDSVTFCADGGYCCGFNNLDCCNDGDSRGIIDYGQSTVVLPNSTEIEALSIYYTGLAVTTLPVSRNASSSAAATSSSSDSHIQAAVTTTVTSIPTGASTLEPSSNSGLSAGAGVGIGVGVSIIVVAVIAALGFIILRRRKPSNPAQPTAQYEPASHPSEAKIETPVPPYYKSPQFHEAPGRSPAHEALDNAPAAAELDSGHR